MSASSKKIRLRSKLLRSAAVYSALLGAMTALPMASALAQTWTGLDGSGSWIDGLNWDTDTVPNSSSAAVSILLPLNNPVTLGSSVSISTLTLGTGTSFNQTGGNLAVFGGSIANAGAVGLGGYVQLFGDLTISGAGTTTLNGGQIGTDGNGRTLYNSSTIAGYGSIGSAAGPLSSNLSFNNSGTVNATSTVNTLTIGGSGNVTNSGTLEATGGGSLSLASGTINNKGGNITASGAGSVVGVNTEIQGGTFNTSGGGVIQTSGGGAYLNGSSGNGGIAISNGSTYTGGSGTSTRISGPLSLGTGATLALSGDLQLDGDVTLSGAGGVTLSGGQIGTDANGRTLNNQVTIQGYGVIGSNAGSVYQNLGFNNSGTVNANSSTPGNSLSIQGTGGPIINSGLLEATAGGTLNLQTQTAINNNGGNITATGAGSLVTVNTEVQGGTYNTSLGGVIETGTAGAYLNGASGNGGITISAGSTYTAGTAAATRISGSLALGTGASFAVSGQLQLDGDLTVSGPGTVTMSGAQIGTDANGRTLNNQTTMQGYGVIGSNVGAAYQNLAFNNTGLVNANSAGNTLSIQGTGGPITNSGTLEATGGSTLNLQTQSAINNNGGNITASGAGSLVTVNTQIQGGTLNTSGGAVMETGTAGAYLNSSTGNGQITISDGSTYTAGNNTVTDMAGTLNLGTSTGATLALSGQVVLLGDVTLAGPGKVTMSGGQFGTDSNGRTLNNKATIEGSGVIGSNVGVDYQNLAFNNTGTVNANSAGNTLSIQGTGGPITNSNLLEATNGGILSVSTANALNNNGGNITASGPGSTVIVNTQLQGGTLNSVNGGVLEGGNNTYLNGATGNGAITLSAGSTYQVDGLTGTTLNQAAGTLNLDAGSTMALTQQLQLVGDLTLSGPGTFTMSGNAQIGTDGNGRTLNNELTILGSGVIGSNSGSLFQNLAVNNTGTIDANSSGNTLFIQGTGTLTNQTLVEATNGGILQLSSNVVNSNGGNITASGAGSTVIVDTQLQGGTLNSSGGGVTEGTNNTYLNGATGNGAITLSAGSTYLVDGVSGTTLNNAAGTLNLGAGSTMALTQQLRLVGDLTLSGTGTFTMSGNAQIGTDGNGRTLNNGATIQGSGVIGSNEGSLSSNMSVNNSGTINANASGKILAIGGSGNTTNSGTLKASNGGLLDIANNGQVNTSGTVEVDKNSTIDITNNGGLVQTAANANIQVDGNLIVVNGVDVQAGLLEGSGVITGNVINDGTVHPGDSPGILHIGGNYGQGSGGALDITLAGLTAGTGYSQLDVSGTASLSGLLDTTLANGFKLKDGDIFDIVNFGIETGDFGSFEFDGAACSGNSADWSCANGVMFQEQFTANALDLVVTDAGNVIAGVPEPGTWGLMLIGFGAVGFSMRRRKRMVPVLG